MCGKCFKYEGIRMNKYEFVGKKVGGFSRIKALKDFSNVKRGDLGGWLEREDSLSQYGKAWVFGDARVSGDAEVFGDAKVSGDAEVYGNDILTSKPQVITGLTFQILCSYKDNYIRIGCKSNSLDDWRRVLTLKSKFKEEFFDDRTYKQTRLLLQALLKGE